MGQQSRLLPIARSTVTEEIVKRVVGLILDNDLRPGDKLPSERDFMAQLQVGRSSLREAIKTLSATGVVEVAVGEGMFVGRGSALLLTKTLAWGLLMSERTTREVVEARQFVEVELAGLAAERATDEQVAGIGHRLQEMMNSRDGVLFNQHDIEFHLAIGRAAQNRVLFHVLETLQQISRAWMEKILTNYFQGDPRPSLVEHVPIYEAISNHDVQGARQAMTAQLTVAGARLLSVIAIEQEDKRGQIST